MSAMNMYEGFVVGTHISTKQENDDLYFEEDGGDDKLTVASYV